MANQEVVVISGYIRALPRISGKEEASVALVTDDEQEYRILHKGVGVDLVEHISANAELTGIIIPSGEESSILVRSYRLTDGFEDEWYDDTTE